MNRQTTLAKNHEVARNWLHVDATDMIVGRLSTKLAMILMGKNKPEYTPHHDVGDFVVVTNVDKLRMTGSKLDMKFLQRYSRYPGGQTSRSYRWLMENQPELLLERSVRRMMPGNKMAAAQLKKMKMYRGSEHPHQAQEPKPLAM